MRERVEAIIQHGCGDWREFVDPARIVIAESPHAVRSTLDEVERLTRDLGLHAVGFVSYEAGLAFDLATRPPNTATPLASFGLFRVEKRANNNSTCRRGQLPAGVAPSNE